MNKSILLKAISWFIAVVGILTFAISDDKGLMVDFSLFVLIVVTLVALLFSFMNILKKPELFKQALKGLGLLLVILIASYLIASDEAVYSISGDVLVESGSTSKWVGTGVVYSLILLTIGMALFLWDMVKNASK